MCSKRKQRLYYKFLKTRNHKSELKHKSYKNFIETIAKCPKKLHYSKLIIEYKENVKKHGQYLKKIQEKKKNSSNHIQKKCFQKKRKSQI